jgi:hypothetical protein
MSGRHCSIPTRTVRRQAGEVDPLHSALSALAQREDGERACVQLVVSRATNGTGRSGHRDRPRWERILIAVLCAPFAVFLAVTDALMSRPTSSHLATTTTPRAGGSGGHRAAVGAKQAHGPHLPATKTTGPDPLYQRIRPRREWFA